MKVIVVKTLIIKKTKKAGYPPLKNYDFQLGWWKLYPPLSRREVIFG
jgi:hypothetical protein|tara:strand:- start:610 stop:750 length:141 start_codon:yes stop_codon:yes gene_type:complete